MDIIPGARVNDHTIFGSRVSRKLPPQATHITNLFPLPNDSMLATGSTSCNELKYCFTPQLLLKQQALFSAIWLQTEMSLLLAIVFNGRSVRRRDSVAVFD
jgi:hypothetical protein